MEDKLGAIFLPMISIKAATYFVCFIGLMLGFCIFFLPAQANFPIAKFVIADALGMGQRSDFPFALMVTYSLAIYLALICAFITGFAKSHLNNLMQFRERSSVSLRILSNFVFFLLLAAPFIQDHGAPHEWQISYSFFSVVLHNR